MAQAIGQVLRKLRLHNRLSLREVEQLSLLFAGEGGDPSYKVSASWLNRLECEEHELTAPKLIVLAHIYAISAEQLLRAGYPSDMRPVLLRQVSGPDETTLLTKRAAQERVKSRVPDRGGPEPPDQSSLFPGDDVVPASRFRRGVIGKRDRTLDPMIPPGSIVQIDTQMRGILSRQNWRHEFERPIYFFKTGDEYVCGWCELDKTSGWLTLTPHPLSPASSRRWKYPLEIENIGRVVGTAIRFAG